MKLCLSFATFLLAFQIASNAEIKITTDHNSNESASPEFKFKSVPSPARTNAAISAKFTIVDGERDDNGGELEKLHDGKLPTEEDQPAENFFFNAGTEGGRLLMDLGRTITIAQVNTYSWHPNTRGPQVYKLYGADGTGDGFKEQPGKGTDPEKSGWKLLASVDTRPKSGDGGGQYGVSISDSEGPLGRYRYLLFDMARTENEDPFGNTFYSEITVIPREGRFGGRRGQGDSRAKMDTNRIDTAFLQHGGSCVLASYAIIANYFTGTPVTNYFEGYCEHFGLKYTNALEAEQKYAAHFDNEWRKRDCRGYQVILDLHSNSPVKCFAEARQRFDCLFYLDSSAHVDELTQLLTNKAFLNITYEPGHDYHSITVFSQATRRPESTNLMARDTNRKDLYSIAGLSEIGKLRDSVLYVYRPFITHSADKSCEISFDTCDAPKLGDWAEHTLAPVLAEWYPKITAMLPSDGYSAPKAFSVTIEPERPGNVAATGGTRVTANSNWLMRRNGEMDPEAVGALLHEEVHVVQQYGWARRQNPDASRPPDWLVEGIPDYIRWFLYEPQSHGADVTWMKRTRRPLDSLHYDRRYRITANFLNWATIKYKKDLVTSLNAAIREGKYSDDLWKDYTAHSLEELDAEWRAELEKDLGTEPPPTKPS